jgi:hypothetical protein
MDFIEIAIGIEIAIEIDFRMTFLGPISIAISISAETQKLSSDYFR